MRRAPQGQHEYGEQHRLNGEQQRVLPPSARLDLFPLGRQANADECVDQRGHERGRNEARHRVEKEGENNRSEERSEIIDTQNRVFGAANLQIPQFDQKRYLETGQHADEDNQPVGQGREDQVRKAHRVEHQQEDHRKPAAHRQQRLDLQQRGHGVVQEPAFGEHRADAHREHVQPDGHAVPQHGIASKINCMLSHPEFLRYVSVLMSYKMLKLILRLLMSRN